MWFFSTVLRMCGRGGSSTFSCSRFLLGNSKYRKVHPVTEDVTNPLTKPCNIDKGALHVVSVPIGNLKDFTYRAVDVLRRVDYIITSDRPATKTLLDLVDIPSQGRLIHYTPQNKSVTASKLVEMLKGGRSIALVVTSGTPCVGDIGSDLVQIMLESGVRVTAVPGASAILSALSTCGESATSSSGERSLLSPTAGPAPMPSGSFFFGNMLPSSHGARLRFLRDVVGPAVYPCVFYEIPRRLPFVLEDMAKVIPGRRLHITHELTKMNESIHSDTVERLCAFYHKAESRALVEHGQIVMVVSGTSPEISRKRTEGMIERRRRFRKRVVEELKCDPALKLQGCSETSGLEQEELHKTAKKREKNLGSARLRRRMKRLRVLKKIEEEQARLRLFMTANRMDSRKHL